MKLPGKFLFSQILLLIVLLPTACSEQKTAEDVRIIDVAGSIGSGRVVNLSEIAGEIQYIPLETTDESILGNPYNNVLFEEGVFYFIQMRDVIKIFDKNGHFLKVFNRYGRGPQEYESLGNLQIDNKTDRICVKSYNKIVDYKRDGQFVRYIESAGRSDLEGYSYSSSLKLDDNLYVLRSSARFATDSGYSAVAIDSTSKVILKIKYPEGEREFVKKMSRIYPFAEPYIFKFKDRVRIVNGSSEFILGVDKNLNVDTSYILNYGKYNIRSASLGMRFNSNIPFVHRFTTIFESDNYLFMKFNLGSLAHKPRVMLKGGEAGAAGKTYSDPISCSLFNKKTGEFTLVDQPESDQMGFVDDMEGGPAIWPLYISEDGYMVSCITAIDFISYAAKAKVSEKLRKIAENLKETDNPVLVLVKLK